MSKVFKYKDFTIPLEIFTLSGFLPWIQSKTHYTFIPNMNPSFPPLSY